MKTEELVRTMVSEDIDANVLPVTRVLIVVTSLIRVWIRWRVKTEQLAGTLLEKVNSNASACQATRLLILYGNSISTIYQ